MVTRLTYGQVSFLLTGDIEAGVEQALVGAGRDGAHRDAPLHTVSLRSTVLKLAHHGSCGSSTQAFLDAVDPELVVVSVGGDNHFGHPCDEVLERLDTHAERQRSVRVYRTDEHGAVEIISDGTRVWVEVQNE